MRALWSVTAPAVAAGAILMPAAAATAQPAQPDNAQQVIADLQADGYDVVLDRIGSAPLDECIVTSVRNPQEYTNTIPVGNDDDRHFVTVVVSRSITVSLNCTR